MKAAALFILLVAAMALISAESAYAEGSSHTIAISCVIPAIPGVNTPLIEQEAPKEDAAAKDFPVQRQEEISKQAPEMIQQDLKQEKKDNHSKESLVLVRTLYGR